MFIIEQVDESLDDGTVHEERSAALTQPEVIVTERVLRERQLRNALVAFSEEPDAQVVKIVAPTSRYPPFHVIEPRVIQYDDQVYRVTSEEFGSDEA